MKRSGFTMIELIFVIVILGILASVAIPKLAATRDDAKISKALNELATLKNDFASYYTSKGTYVATTITDETNVPLYKDTGCKTPATSINSGTPYYYCVPKTGSGSEPLVKITPNDTNGTLAFVTQTVTGNIGSAVKASNTYTSLTTSVNNGGSRVAY